MDDRTGQRSRVAADLQKIILSKASREILIRHAEDQRPNEACAILFGDKNTVLDVVLTENAAKSPTSFTISPEELINVYNMEKSKKMNIIGIFHSHPNSDAYPSETDEKFMECNPVVWIIYSGIDKDFKAYTLDRDVTEVLIAEEA